MNRINNSVRAVKIDLPRLHITPHIYAALAEGMLENIGPRNSISTTLHVEDGDTTYLFMCSAVIYRRSEQRPDCDDEVISNVVPIWWELRSFRGEDVILNDFSFDEMKEYLINRM